MSGPGGPGLPVFGFPDLSLYSDAQLRTDVSPNPWAEHEKLAAGRPAEIGGLAAAFARAGGDLDLAYRFSNEAQQLIGANFTNDGKPVYSPDVHAAGIPRNFPDAGTQLVGLARRLDGVADDLNQRTQDTASVVNTLAADLQELRTGWATEVDAAIRAASGLVLLMDLGPLIARRDTLRQQQRSMVSRAGGTARISVGEYERGLNDVMRLLADIGYLPPDAVPLGPGDPRFTAGAGTDDANDVANALDGGQPDLRAVDAASEGVQLLNAKVAAGGTLTPEEAQYLQAYYDRLASSGTFARLEGSLGTTSGADGTLTTFANGLMNLSQVEDGRFVPRGVHDLLAADVTDYHGGRFTYEGTAALIGRATVDGGTTFTRQLGESALHAMQDQAWADRQMGPNAEIGRARDMQPMNTLLHVVARDAEAGQALVGDRGNRHVLLAAPGAGGEGAAAVLTAATKPAQATPQLATRSAELSRDLFVELGEDPASWRAVIPKGSDVSDAITRLAAQRIDTFGYSSGSTEAIQAAQQTADGTWTAGVRLGSDRESPSGDDRIDFLKFVATGADLDDPRGDRDVQLLQAAADAYVVHELSGAMRSGGDVANPLGRAGDLSGVIARAQFEALVDQSAEADAAAARAHADRNFGITLAERAIAANAIGRAPAPVNAIIGDTFMLSFDRTLATISPPPEPQTGVRAADLFDAQNQDYLDHRAYLVAMAKQEAGELAPGTWTGDRPDTVFDADGRLRPFDAIPEQSDGDPLRDLRNIANAPPSTAPPPNTPDWATSLQNSGETFKSYDSSRYVAEDNPDTYVTNGYRAELLYGDQAADWIDYVYGDDGYPGPATREGKI